MNSGIYAIKNLVNNKVYVGSTINFKDREYRHFYTLEKNKHKNPHLQLSFNKYGKNNFQFQIILYCELADFVKMENFYMNYFNSTDRKYGYNIEDADRCVMSSETKIKISKALTGRKCPHRTEETKNKISKSLMGHVGHNLNQPMANETKIKISQALTGKKKHLFSDEEKNRLRTLRTGVKHSEETKMKMSKSRKGRIPSEEHRKNLSKSQIGREFSEEHLKNLSEAQKRRWERTKNL